MKRLARRAAGRAERPRQATGKEARTLGTSKDESNSQARAQMQSYIRRLLGSSKSTSGQVATSSAKLSLPKSSSSGAITATPPALPKQLEAIAYTKTPTKASSGSSTGNIWLISPIASTVKSIFDLFSGGSSSSQSTRYRAKSRAPFRLVESISPETESGTNRLNESAAALTGVTSQSRSNGSGTSNPTASVGGINVSGNLGSSAQMNNREELVTALRRGLVESRGITDVLTEFQDGL